MYMKRVSIVDMRIKLSSLLAFVAKGGEVLVHKRNIPIAKIVPLSSPKKNHTKLDCGRGSVKKALALTEPMIPEDSWEMLK